MFAADKPLVPMSAYLVLNPISKCLPILITGHEHRTFATVSETMTEPRRAASCDVPRRRWQIWHLRHHEIYNLRRISADSWFDSRRLHHIAID
jgi:hypothetical protein